MRSYGRNDSPSQQPHDPDAPAVFRPAILEQRSPLPVKLHALRSVQCFPEQLDGMIPATNDTIDAIRHINCHAYDDCLDVAAACDWKSFSCERCPAFVDVERREARNAYVRAMEQTIAGAPRSSLSKGVDW